MECLQCRYDVVERMRDLEKEIFLQKLAELMDTEMELSMDTMLETVEDWDSLSYIAYMAFCLQNTGKKVSPNKVKSAQSVGDLYLLMYGE